MKRAYSFYMTSPTKRHFKRFCAALALGSVMILSSPSYALAEEAPHASTSTPASQENERGQRIDKDFDASHPSEWIAIGVAIGLAVALAYAAGRRRRNRE
jgi:hypothetical protein